MTIEQNPEIICRVVALFEYQATIDTESHLNLRVGDIIDVLVQEPNGWWSGTSSSGSGWFPASYVEPVPAELQPSAPDTMPPVPPPLDFTPPLSSALSPISVVAAFSLPQPPAHHADWEQHFTEGGEAFYVHRHTGESSWEIPDKENINLSPVSDTWDVGSATPNNNEHATVDTLIVTATVSHELTGGDDNVKDSAYEEVSNLGDGVSELSIATPSLAKSKLDCQLSVRSLNLAETRGAPAASEDGRYGYGNNFWSDKDEKTGFEILVNKHKNGKEVCKDIATFMHERAKIEEIYAKSLLDLAKSQLGNSEQGTAKTAWNQVKFDLQTQAQSRLKFAASLTEQVHKPILQFKNDQKKMRKNYEVTITSERKNMVTKFMNAQKTQRIYAQRSKEAELAGAGLVAAMSKKDYSKFEEHAKRERKRASMAAYDYKTSIDDYESTRSRWAEDMQTACSEFQQAEEERLEFLKNVLQKYLAVQKSVNTECKESSEMVESSIDSVSKEIDIEMFVKQYYTGPQKPPQLKFEQISQYI